MGEIDFEWNNIPLTWTIVTTWDFREYPHAFIILRPSYPLPDNSSQLIGSSCPLSDNSILSIDSSYPLSDNSILSIDSSYPVADNSASVYRNLDTSSYAMHLSPPSCPLADDSMLLSDSSCPEAENSETG